MEITSDLVKEIYRTGVIHDEVGQALPLHSQISHELADTLYRTVLNYKPRTVLEVGMAYGLSTLAVLSALRDIGQDGRLISIDPNQHSEWKGVGVANVERSGLSGRHQLIESFDYLVLPKLLSESVKLDFAYIDGWHTFDYVLLDFFFIDKMLNPGGVVGFNDCGYRAVHKVLRFISSHRKYREIDVGLQPDYAARNPAFSLIRRFTGRNGADRYFEKLEDWEPSWNYFSYF